MKYRLLQFYRGLFASVSGEDRKLLEAYLSPEEINCFGAMSRGVQIHSLWVAKTLMEWRTRDLHPLGGLRESEWKTLIRGALFHDMGKPEDLKLTDRIGIVLYQWAQRLIGKEPALPYGSKYRENLLHPEKGEMLALKLNLEPQVIEIIRNHHRSTSSDALSHYITLADRVN